MSAQEKTSEVRKHYVIIKLDEEFVNTRTPFDGWQAINLFDCKKITIYVPDGIEVNISKIENFSYPTEH